MSAATAARDLAVVALRFGVLGVGIGALAFVAPNVDVHAQGAPRAPVEPPGSPRESAPFDMSGYWVAIVNEEWRWRMMTPPKGDVTSVQPLNERGREAANAWDIAQDGSCKAYGAAGLMRMPTRLRIGWESDSVLRIETDAGRQTRLLRFGASAVSSAPSLQGDSTAQWLRATQSNARGAGSPTDAGGSLLVTTTNLLPGWLRRNGVPYSEQTSLTEYFDRFAAPNGDEWLVVTTIVEDPVYLNDRYITSSHFRREADGSGWNPTPCRAD